MGAPGGHRLRPAPHGHPPAPARRRLPRRVVGLRAPRPTRGRDVRRPRRADRRLGRHRGPGLLDHAGPRPPAVHQHPDAVPRPPAERPRRQPHRGAPPHGHVARLVGGAAPGAARGRRRDRALRPRRRRAAGHGQGLEAAPRGRPHRSRRGRTALRAGPHRGPLVRRHLPRGPGPLAPRRPAPQRLRVRHASGPRGRHPRHRRLRPGHRRGTAAHRGVGRRRRPRAPRLDRAGRSGRPLDHCRRPLRAPHRVAAQLADVRGTPCRDRAGRTRRGALERGGADPPPARRHPARRRRHRDRRGVARRRASGGWRWSATSSSSTAGPCS